MGTERQVGLSIWGTEGEWVPTRCPTKYHVHRRLLAPECIPISRDYILSRRSIGRGAPISPEQEPEVPEEYLLLKG